MENEKILNLIKLSLWGSGTAFADRDTYEEMKRQAIATLPAPSLSSISMSEDLRQEWKMFIIEQLISTTQCNFMQSILPITVPYVILKGTSAAKYYPYPEYRMMGDIDIMTQREDLETACQQLMADGFCVEKSLNREISFVKNWIEVELHRRFATLNDPIQAKYLDDLICENITPSHVLPDLINGLVILEHIDQHLEGGLGLRQIIDWMMFVDKCLPDDKWPDFLERLKKIGLERLAIACTRMCEIYLGLPCHEFCADANEALCEQLMNYVMACGNFGNKKTSDADISENAISYSSTLRAGFRLLQRQGLVNWKAAQKHKALRPFAWIYQLFRYASKGLNRDQAILKLREEYSAARKKNKMFDALGIKTIAKGIVVLEDGKYKKD